MNTTKCSDGFVGVGDGLDEWAGYSLAVGDFNKDGLNEIFVGAPKYNMDLGRVFFVRGNSGCIASPISLGFYGGIAFGESLGGRLGWSVASGDINNDGYDDVVMGAPLMTYSTRTNAGAVYVLFGSSSFSPSWGLQTLTMKDGFKIVGAHGGSNFGYSVTTADVNGDSIADIIIGAPYANSSTHANVGRVAVIFGSATKYARNASSSETFVIDTATLSDRSVGVFLSGEDSADMFGAAVSSAGDFNCDGIEDLIIGAYNKSYGRGKAYVVFGRHTMNSSSEWMMKDLNSSSYGIFITGSGSGFGQSNFGKAVGSAGNFDGLQCGDVVIGAPGYGNKKGAAFVLYGKSSNSDIDVLTMSSSSGVMIEGTTVFGMSGEFGWSVGSLGDYNSDGKSDVMVGMPFSTVTSGQGYGFGIYGGESSYNSSALGLDSKGFIITAAGGYQFGSALSSGSFYTSQGSYYIVGAYGAKTTYTVSYASSPTISPTVSRSPSRSPTPFPTATPSCTPTATTSTTPTIYPSSQPSSRPSNQPTAYPSVSPSTQPSTQPSSVPSISPSKSLSVQPSSQPSSNPTTNPSCRPSSQPSRQPSTRPSVYPSSLPSSQPLTQPSDTPSCYPSCRPSNKPSCQPTSLPSSQPSTHPSPPPSPIPTVFPTPVPTDVPTPVPTDGPTTSPTTIPSSIPSSPPTRSPTLQPTISPTLIPSVNPTAQPTAQPTRQPSALPSVSSSFSPSFHPTETPPQLKRLLFSLSTSTVVEDSTILGFVNWRLSSPPDLSLGISILLENQTRVAQNSILSPSSFSVTSSSPLSGSNVLLSKSPGIYQLQFSISGPSVKEYNITYPRLTVVNILSRVQESPTPILQAGVFSSDGSSIFVKFNGSTNQANNPTTFECSDLFVFQGVNTSMCTWRDTSSIQIYQISSETSQLLVVNSVIRLKSVSTFKAACPNGIDCGKWKSIPSGIVYVSAPSHRVLPDVQLSGPSLISVCQPLVLDLTSSSGNAGRPWNISVKVDNNPRNLTNIQVIEKFFFLSYQFSPPSKIASNLLLRNVTYTFTVTLCNFLNACSSKSLIVKVVSDAKDVPLVTVYGTSTLTIYRRFPLTVKSNSYTLDCAGNPSQSNLLITWNLNVLSGDVSQSTINQVQSINAQRIPSIYSLLAYTLPAASSYELNLVVKHTLSGVTSTAKVLVNVLQGSLIPVIGGGSTQSIQLNTVSTIDGSSSYDQDQVNVKGKAAGLSYRWSCSLILPSYREDCSGIIDFQSGSSTSEKALLLANNVSSLSTTAQLVMTINDATRSAGSSLCKCYYFRNQYCGYNDYTIIGNINVSSNRININKYHDDQFSMLGYLVRK